ARLRARRAQGDRRAEAGADARAQGDIELQAAPGDADWRDGNAAARKDVGVFRPAGEYLAAARARLPRRQRQGLRRPRQLLARAQGTYDFSRTQPRQGRESEGPDDFD